MIFQIIHVRKTFNLTFLMNSFQKKKLENNKENRCVNLYNNFRT